MAIADMIKKPTDPFRKDNILCMIVGGNGIGKTRLAQSAPKPLLLDFENRIKDSGIIVADYVEQKYLRDYKTFKAESLNIATLAKQYDTIIVDTADELFNIIMNHLKQVKDYKNNMKLYGDALNEMIDIMNNITLGIKNVVYLAHEKLLEYDGRIKRVPAVAGSFKQYFASKSDLTGYMTVETGRNKEVVREIDFSNCAEFEGKCPLSTKHYVVPNIIAANTFLADIFGDVYNFYNSMTSEQKAAAEEIEKIRTNLENVSSPSDIEMLVDSFASLDGAIKNQARAMLKARMKELGIKYNKDTKQYESN